MGKIRNAFMCLWLVCRRICGTLAVQRLFARSSDLYVVLDLPEACPRTRTRIVSVFFEVGGRGKRKREKDRDCLAACPCQAEKIGSMANVEGGGGKVEWDVMNGANKKMAEDFLKKGGRQVNVGKSIGLPLVQCVD